MSRSSRLLLAAWVLGQAPLVIAQTEKPAAVTPAKSVADEEPCDVRFRDRSNVRMTIVEESLLVATKYGQLTIPTKDIRQIDFGMHMTAETRVKIDRLIEALGDESFAKREESAKELVKLGQFALPAVRRATKNEDPEVARRAKSCLAELEKRLPADELKVRDTDTIQALEFTAVGRILTPGIKARTAYFGDVVLKPGQLKEIRWRRIGGQMELAVDAAKHGSPDGEWMDTGIEIEAGRGIAITASGTVDLWPREPEVGRYVANPDGIGGSSPFVGRGAGEPAGALLGRIGKGGAPFKIGQRYESTPTTSGTLHLRIGASNWGVESRGSYQVVLQLND